MRILVTGAHGYVGSHVWPHLVAAGHEVFAVSRNPPSQSPPGITNLASDLLIPGEPVRLAREIRPDLLVHLAWTVEHGKFWTDPANLDWVAASLNLARACADQGCRRIVATGTCFEYAWPADGDCVEAVTPLATHSLYDSAKSALYAVLEPWARANGLSLVWPLIFYLYGGAEHPARLVADIARHVVRGDPALCSSGSVRRDFMDVRDAGAAIAATALSTVKGAVNIGTGSGPRIADIAMMIGEIAGRASLIQLGARADRPDEPPRIVADIRRLREEVGFHQIRPLRQGLTEAVEWWRARA